MADQLVVLQAALAGRYAVERELGRGGMATVYLAQDRKHQRPVAVKVLRPELAHALGAERFLREIQIAAGLTHPHILPLLDSGRTGGVADGGIDEFLYYVMPYVDGESLRDRLTREKQLCLDDALRITREVADALSHAHSHDIVHRDIKPENVLFEAGHAVLSDFGIARAITAAGGGRLTETGLAVGTPVYMSPEQAIGQAQLDGRSDIYSLACVLYEMLGGEPPFSGSTPQAIFAKRLSEPVPHIRTLRDTVPLALEAALTKALARVPADRFATAAQFAEALAAADLAEPAPEKSIAVLPFANMSADPEAEYFSDGMSEEIINALARVPGLRVAARTSSFAFKGRSLDLRTVGRTLSVARVLEGSVRQAGQRLRVTAQLIDVADGYHLWSDRFDRNMADVFAVQDEIAGAIVSALKVELAVGAEAPRPGRGTQDLEAYDLYLRGRHYWNQRMPAQAVEYFQQSIGKDPNYAQAYAGLADAMCVFGHYGFYPSKDAFAKARSAAQRAVAIDETLWEGHFSLACTDLYFGWDFPAAEREFRRAISLNPSAATPRAFLALQLSLYGRYDDALMEVKRAEELEPLSAQNNSVCGCVYHWARREQEAIDACERAMEIAPGWGAAVWVRSMAYTNLGRHDEAIAGLRKAVDLMQQSPWLIGVLGVAYARAGRTAEARAVLKDLVDRSQRQYVAPFLSAWIHFALGEADLGFAAWEKALEDRNAFACYVASNMGLEHLRSDPRYVALLRKARLDSVVALVTTS